MTKTHRRTICGIIMLAAAAAYAHTFSTSTIHGANTTTDMWKLILCLAGLSVTYRGGTQFLRGHHTALSVCNVAIGLSVLSALSPFVPLWKGLLMGLLGVLFLFIGFAEWRARRGDRPAMS